jgi:hypothetical protein
MASAETASASPVHDLPLEWQRVDPKAKKLWKIQAAAGSLFYLAILLPFDLIFSRQISGWPLPAAVTAVLLWLIILGLSVYMAGRKYENWAYALRERDLAVAFGIFWKNRDYVPRSRIQHVDVSAGPIERNIGLVTMSVFVGGGTGAVASISGLDPAIAEGLRREVMGIEEEEETVIKPPPAQPTIEGETFDRSGGPPAPPPTTAPPLAATEREPQEARSEGDPNAPETPNEGGVFGSWEGRSEDAEDERAQDDEPEQSESPQPPENENEERR